MKKRLLCLFICLYGAAVVTGLFASALGILFCIPYYIVKQNKWLGAVGLFLFFHCCFAVDVHAVFTADRFLASILKKIEEEHTT